MDDSFALPYRHAADHLLDVRMRHFDRVDLDALHAIVIGVANRSLGSPIFEYANTYSLGDLTLVVAAGVEESLCRGRLLRYDSENEKYRGQNRKNTDKFLHALCLLGMYSLLIKVSSRINEDRRIPQGTDAGSQQTT
jgi:hypothetical protein